MKEVFHQLYDGKNSCEEIVYDVTGYNGKPWPQKLHVGVRHHPDQANRILLEVKLVDQSNGQKKEYIILKCGSSERKPKPEENKDDEDQCTFLLGSGLLPAEFADLSGIPAHEIMYFRAFWAFEVRGEADHIVDYDASGIVCRGSDKKIKQMKNNIMRPLMNKDYASVYFRRGFEFFDKFTFNLMYQDAKEAMQYALNKDNQAKNPALIKFDALLKLAREENYCLESATVAQCLQALQKVIRDEPSGSKACDVDTGR